MDDLISRQAAIDAIQNAYIDTDGGEDRPMVWINAGLTKALHIIQDLPSVQPKAIRPKFVAEDRYIKNHFSTYPHCPKCNYELETGDCYCKVCGCHIDWSEDDEWFNQQTGGD